MRREFVVLLLAAIMFIPGSAISKKKIDEPVGLQLIDKLPKDPLLFTVANIENLDSKFDEMLGFMAGFDESLAAEKVDAKLAEFDAKLGCSLRDDLLAQIGPEFGGVLDLPPIDQLVGSLSTLDVAMSLALEKFAMLAMVRDRERLDPCLRKLFALDGAEIAEEDGLVRVHFGGPEAARFNIYFGFKENFLAIGTSPDFVSASLAPRVEGARLMDGNDFSQVFSHLDEVPQTLLYVNLPKVRTLIENSSFVQNMLDSQPKSRMMADLFLSPEFAPMGFGSSSIETGGGTRTTSFGPSSFSGGAAYAGIVASIAIPNFLNAVDRGKQKRTMADIRSAGTAIESYSIDHNVYPGPTDGWVTAEGVESALEPIYIRTLPEQDGWGNPLLFLSDGENYVIVSPGKDGVLDRDWSDGGGPGASSSFTNDIVFANGRFVAWPEGTQQ